MIISEKETAKTFLDLPSTKYKSLEIFHVYNSSYITSIVFMYHCYYFQVAIDDISVKMQENFQCSERLRLENNELVHSSF